MLNELHEDAAAMSAHHATAHDKAYAARIGDLADRRVLMLDPADIA